MNISPTETLEPLEAAVLQSLVLMGELLANPRPVTPVLVQGWVLVLRRAGVQPHEVEQGVGKLLETATFFPTPADFLQAVRPPEDQEAREELAWQRVLSLLRTVGSRASLAAADFGGDGTALWAVSRIGWDRLGREMVEEKRAIWRAEFARIYRAGRTEGETLAYLPGQFERDNDAQGRDLSPLAVGRPDWEALPGTRREALPAGRRGLDEPGGMARLVAALPASLNTDEGDEDGD